MPVLLPVPQAQVVEDRSLYENGELSHAEGTEYASLRQNIWDALGHWGSRQCATESARGGAEVEQIGDLGYRHVPLTRAEVYWVQYKDAEPLKPRRFQLDEDE